LVASVKGSGPASGAPPPPCVADKTVLVGNERCGRGLESVGVGPMRNVDAVDDGASFAVQVFEIEYKATPLMTTWFEHIGIAIYRRHCQGRRFRLIFMSART
jgi:hypothetical protein